jgi:hypothetical protein
MRLSNGEAIKMLLDPLVTSNHHGFYEELPKQTAAAEIMPEAEPKKSGKLEFGTTASSSYNFPIP